MSKLLKNNLIIPIITYVYTDKIAMGTGDLWKGVCMDIKVHLTLEDYQEFNNSYALKKLKGSVNRFKLFGFICIFLLLGYIVTSQLSTNFNNISDLVGEGRQGNSSLNLYMFLAFIGILIIGILININKRTKEFYNSNTLLRAQQNYSFFDDHIDINSENGYSRITWDQVNSIVFLKSCYAIFISTVQALVIPRRILSQTEVSQLEGIFTRCLPLEKIKK